MKKKILLALLIVVILLGIGGVYAYFETSVFKTGKEIFFSQIETEMFSDLEDEKLLEYAKKQEETAYTNKGEMSIKLNGDDLGTEAESMEMLNKSKIALEGKIDNSKKIAEQTITVDLAQGFNIPIQIKRDGDTFGIQSDLLDSKFIAIRNENLKELLERFDITAEEIPDKIELSQQQFTEEELKTLKEKYVAILNNNLEEELFGKEKVNNQTVVTLKMSEQKFVDIVTKILETMRDDEILLNKMSGIYKKDQIQEEINKMIEELKDTTTDESNMLEIRMYIESKNMKKLEMAFIEDNETTMLAVLEYNTNQITMKMYEETKLVGEFNISKETSGNDVSYTIKFNVDSEDDGKVEISFKLQYKNLLALDNVEENYEVNLSYEGVNQENTEMKLNYKNLKTFSPDIEIEGLNDDNALIINDATDEEIQTLLRSIYLKLGLMQ